MGNILETIDDPKILHTFLVEQLEQLAGELREFIVENVSKTGGHLAPSLGTIELTLALYSVFNFPFDKLVWDVGHQAYAHKILTGRRDRFSTLRQKDGITGFPNMAESAYDAFGVGHASTSVSAALGMAIARDVLGTGEHVIAVIGDGALTGGEAFEALNHAGDLHKDIIVILNDNGMSIDYNVGAISEYLSRIRMTPHYNKAKKDIEGILRSIPHIGDTVWKTASQIKDGVRSALVPGSFFEELGFKYFGPIDGHNISLMKEVFSEISSLSGPVLIHVKTKKGKGYLPAEAEPDHFHGIGKFDANSGKSISPTTIIPSYTDVFSQALIEIAEKNSKIVAVTAAMPSGTGLKQFSEKFPKRFFDVGIAEEHAVTMAAGMATRNLHPVVAIYSTFMQRAYDQILHDVCLQKLPVTLCLDRAGLVGEDGATHHGVFDLSYLRHIPGLIVMAPKDENELRHMLNTAVNTDMPVALRYPRGIGLGVTIENEIRNIEIGKAEILRDGSNITFFAIGTMVKTALDAADLLEETGIKANVINMRFVTPLDKEIISDFACKSDMIITIEENVLAGGFGSAIIEVITEKNISVSVLRFGIPNDFIHQGTRLELLKECGLQPQQISAKIREYLNDKEIS